MLICCFLLQISVDMRLPAINKRCKTVAMCVSLKKVDSANLGPSLFLPKCPTLNPFLSLLSPFTVLHTLI